LRAAPQGPAAGVRGDRGRGRHDGRGADPRPARALDCPAPRIAATLKARAGLGSGRPVLYIESMSSFRDAEVRPPAVASLFYPADARVLAEEVASYLDQTEEAPLAPGFPKAVIVPHAGFIYSGPVAASAYDHRLGESRRERRLLGLDSP